MSDKVKELAIGEDLFSIVAREVKELKSQNGVLEYSEILRMEKLAKIFSILSANGRENVKHHVFSGLSENDLEQLSNDLDDPED